VNSIPGAQLVGPPSASARLFNTVSFFVEGSDSIALLSGLDLEGICASSGSACASGSVNPSHVLSAMGVCASAANALVRLSLGRETSAVEISLVEDALPRVIERCRGPFHPVNNL